MKISFPEQERSKTDTSNVGDEPACALTSPQHLEISAYTLYKFRTLASIPHSPSVPQQRWTYGMYAAYSPFLHITQVSHHKHAPVIPHTYHPLLFGTAPHYTSCFLLRYSAAIILIILFLPPKSS